MKKIYQKLRMNIEHFTQEVILTSGPVLDPNDFDDMILDDIY